MSVVCPGQVATSIVENTRGLRPAEAEKHTARVTAILNGAHESLLTNGVPIDDAGESVVRGMLAGQPFIFTDAHWRPILEAHFAEVLSCIPDAVEAIAD